MVDSLRAQNKNFALLDLGDFVNNENTVGELKTRFIWKMMERMGYLATTPGVREVSNWRLVEELLATSPIKCVSSNLTVVEGGSERPAGLATLVTDIGGVRVGFLGLMGGNELSTAKPPDGIEFRHQDPVTTAQKLVPELRKQAELVVLLSEMSTQETADVLGKTQGIDVALYGRQPAWNERADKVVNTITQQTGIRGQFVGELILIVDPDGRIVDYGSRNAPLDSKFPENAEVAAQIKQTDTESKEMLKVDQQRKASDLEGKISSEKFIGADKCQRCHEPEYRQWLTTAHSKAFPTIETAGKGGDQTCVGCHVTGWQQPGGYAATVTDPDLRNVQCESCHEMGTKHERGGKTAHVTKEVCTTCHTGEWAKGFDFATYLAKVTH